MAATHRDHPTSIAQLDFTPRGPVFASPAEWRDIVMYELMVDRFDDAQDHPPYDPTSAPRGRDPAEGVRFQGGRIAGITRRLDYIRNLGATAIWITPPVKNRANDPGSYHGYGAQNFLEIDPRFGSVQDLQTMVRQAHQRGIYVVMDIVIDHAGDVFAYRGGKDHLYHQGRRFGMSHFRNGSDGGAVGGKIGPDDAVWPVEFQQPHAFKRMGRMNDPGTAADAEAVDGDFLSLKVLDLDNPVVCDQVIAIYKHWIAVADVDGFRIDAYRHVRPEVARRFTHGIREYALSIGKTNFLQIGEIASGGEVLRRYVGSNTPLCDEDGVAHHPQLDAVLDFALYHHLPDVLRGQQSPADLRAHFDLLNTHYRDASQVGKSYVTFLENHDQVEKGCARFLHGMDDHDGRLAVLGPGVLMTMLGIPCLYYGSEQGFNGGPPPDGDKSDRYVREAMFGGQWGAFDTTGVHFFNENNPIYRGIAQIAQVRAVTPALRYGRQYFRRVSGDGRRFGFASDGKGRLTLAYSRVLDRTEVLVAANIDRHDRADRVEVDASLLPVGTTLRNLLNPRQRYTVETGPRGLGFVHLPLKGWTMAILAGA